MIASLLREIFENALVLSENKSKMEERKEKENVLHFLPCLRDSPELIRGSCKDLCYIPRKFRLGLRELDWISGAYREEWSFRQRMSSPHSQFVLN